MRAIDSSCGKHFEAENDQQLATKIQAHLHQDHPDVQMTDEEKREQFARLAHDV